jgi:hypothetical protein
METTKERELTWAREDNERRSRAQSELERDEQELAELEILFTAVRLQRPSGRSGRLSHGSTKKDRKTKEFPRIEGTIFKMW